MSRIMKASSRRRRWLLALSPLTLILLGFAVAPIRLLRIASGSMSPALVVGDRVVISTNGFSGPPSASRGSSWRASSLRRGDVIAFIAPPQMVDLEMHDIPSLVGKRIVGVPGDTLTMRDDRLTINGQPEQRRVILGGRAFQHATDWQAFAWQHAFQVTNSRFGQPPERPTLGDWGPLVVPAKQYFVLGDNRYCSIDSRHWGFLPEANIRGRVVRVYWSSLPELSSFYDPCNGETREGFNAVRWGRVGHAVR
jgi:signal peptidase I